MKSIQVSNSAPQVGWGQGIELDDRFAPMIARLEQSAESQADGYRRKVVGAGLLGYAVLAGFVAVFAGLTLLMVALLFASSGALYAKLKGLIIFGAIAFALLRALRVRRSSPDGISISRAQAPKLFATIDRVRSAVGGVWVHDVRILDDMNAAITQQSTFWCFGSHNTLYIGLPLLLALPTSEFEAVIAHEFGHFAGKHGHSAGFVYRIRMRWAQVAEQLPTGIVAGALRRFFAWYGPWFASYSFVLARQQEYEADRISASIAGQKIAADALARVTIQADRFHRAWGSIWEQSVSSEQPPDSPYRLLAKTLIGDDPKDQYALERALADPGDLDDTHPGLAQRIAALGQAKSIPPTLHATAADELLGQGTDQLIDQLDSDWHAVADENWAADFHERVAQRLERDSLAEQIAANNVSRDDRFQYARLVELIDGPGPAANAYASILKGHPDAHDARYRHGDVLLELGNEAGISELLKAAASELALAPYAYERVATYFAAAGQPDEAERYFDLLRESEAETEKAAQESGSIDESVKLCALDLHLRDRLVDLISTVQGVASLRAAQRQLRGGLSSQIVFVFSARRGVNSSQLLDSIIEALLPAGDLLGVEASVRRRWLARRIDALPGSKIV